MVQSFGANQLDPNSLSILGLNYANAKYAPSMQNAFSSDQQFAFSQPDYTPGALNYQKMRYSTEDFGILSMLKHRIIGDTRGYGYNERHQTAARDEYKRLRNDSIMFGALDLATMGITDFSGVRKGQYLDVQKANYLTSGIIDKKGRLGLSGEKNADLAYTIQKEASKDPLIDKETLDQFVKTVKKTGGLSSATNLSDIKQGIKESLKNVKELMDILGSSDMVGIQKEVSKFTRMGMSLKQGANMVASVNYAAEVSGLSKGKVSDMVSGTIASNAGRFDNKTSAIIGVNNAASIGYYQQISKNVAFMSDKNVAAAVINEADQQIDDMNERQGGVGGSKLRFLSLSKARKIGGSKKNIQKNANAIYDNLSSKTLEDQKEEMSHWYKTASESERHIMTNKKERMAALSSSSVTFEHAGVNEKTGAVKRIISQANKIYGEKKHTFNEFQSAASNLGLTGKPGAFLSSLASKAQDNGGDTSFISLAVRSAEKRKKEDSERNYRNNIKKKSTFWNVIKSNMSLDLTDLKHMIGGGNNAVAVQDKYRDSIKVQKIKSLFDVRKIIKDKKNVKYAFRERTIQAIDKNELENDTGFNEVDKRIKKTLTSKEIQLIKNAPSSVKRLIANGVDYNKFKKIQTSAKEKIKKLEAKKTLTKRETKELDKLKDIARIPVDRKKFSSIEKAIKKTDLAYEYVSNKNKNTMHFNGATKLSDIKRKVYNSYHTREYRENVGKEIVAKITGMDSNNLAFDLLKDKTREDNLSGGWGEYEYYNKDGKIHSDLATSSVIAGKTYKEYSDIAKTNNISSISEKSYDKIIKNYKNIKENNGEKLKKEKRQRIEKVSKVEKLLSEKKRSGKQNLLDFSVDRAIKGMGYDDLKTVMNYAKSINAQSTYVKPIVKRLEELEKIKKENYSSSGGVYKYQEISNNKQLYADNAFKMLGNKKTKISKRDFIDNYIKADDLKKHEMLKSSGMAEEEQNEFKNSIYGLTSMTKKDRETALNNDTYVGYSETFNLSNRYKDLTLKEINGILSNKTQSGKIEAIDKLVDDGKINKNVAVRLKNTLHNSEINSSDNTPEKQLTVLSEIRNILQSIDKKDLSLF